jgi:alpha-1,6-mannosyltransferase
LADFGRHDSESPGRKAGPWLLLASGEVLAVGLWATEARAHLGIYLALCTAGSLLALYAARSLSGSSPAFLLLCAGLFRATLVFRPPALSDDTARYLWDARVAQAGISPYAYAPADPAVSGIAPGLAARVPHADVRTVYPPVAQAVFRAGSLLPNRALSIQVLFGLADLAIVPLILALGGRGAGFAAALYAFHPLAICESAGEGHLDSLGVALLLASLVYLARNERIRAGAAFALSVLTKYVSAFAALPLVRRGGSRWAASGLAVASSVWVAWVRGGVMPVGGLPDYASRWEFNSFAYPALTQVFQKLDVPALAKDAFLHTKERLGHPAWMQPLFPFFYAGFFARAALALALAIVLVVVALRVRDTEAAVFASLGALMLASPTLHPWYLLWVLPFAARRKEPAFLYLSFAVPLSYALLYPVPWMPVSLARFLEYGPFLFLLIGTLVRSAARRKAEELGAVA